MLYEMRQIDEHIDVKHGNETPSVDFKILQQGIKFVNGLTPE